MSESQVFWHEDERYIITQINEDSVTFALGDLPIYSVTKSRESFEKDYAASFSKQQSPLPSRLDYLRDDLMHGGLFSGFGNFTTENRTTKA